MPLKQKINFFKEEIKTNIELMKKHPERSDYYEDVIKSLSEKYCEIAVKRLAQGVLDFAS